MLLLLLATVTCISTTALLTLKANAWWYMTLSLAFFTLMISGEERINFTFAHEHDDFFSFTSYYFVYLSIYFIREPKEPVYILGVPAKRFRNRPLFVSAALTIFGFGVPLYSVSPWTLSEPADWAFPLLSFYMGVVGVFLFKQAWRVRKLRLELQESLEEH